MTEDIKLSFLRKFLISTKDLENYDQLAAQLKRRTIGYFLKLIFIFAFVLSIIYSVQVFKLVNAIKDKINEVPDFSYEDGKITFQDKNPVIIDNVSDLINCILIMPSNTEEVTKEYTTKVKTYSNYLMIEENHFIISIKGNKLQYDYNKILENYSIKSFNKIDLINGLKSVEALTISISFFFVAVINLFIFYGITIGLDACITYLVAFITTRMVRIRLKGSALFNVAIYSLTLSIVLYLLYLIINLLTGFTIARFRLMYILIACVYSAIAILIIKADFIEKQQELAKIIKVQQEVRAEMEEEQDDKKEQEQKDESTDDKNPDSKNENNSDENDGLKLNPEESIIQNDLKKENNIEE